jgi:hypothetical protein
MHPGKFGEDWGVQQMSAGLDGLMQLKQNVQMQAQTTSAVSDIAAGRDIPGRTPSSTVQQILERGNAQNTLFMRAINEAVCKAVRLYLETKRQYSPMGETIPVRDPETKAIIEIPFRLPVSDNGVDPLDNFRISLTAADDRLAKENDQEQLVMLMNVFQQHANFVSQIAGPIINPQTSPAQMAFFKKMADAEQVILNRIMSLTRTDEEKFDMSPELEGVIQEKQQIMLQMQQQEAMNAAQGGSGGPVQGAEGQGDGSGPGGPPQQPGMAPGGGAPPAEGGSPAF